VKRIIMPTQKPLITEVLPLQPKPLSAVGYPEAEHYLFRNLFPDGTFGTIQTQAFGALKGSKENILISAPSTAGRVVCVELALLKLFSEKKDGLAVVLCPDEASAAAKYEYWRERFGRKLGFIVARTTGVLGTDRAILQKCHIMVARPEHFEPMTRRWTAKS